MNGQILLIISECLLMIAATLKLFSGIVSLRRKHEKRILRGNIETEKEINGSVIYPALSLSPTILNDEKENG